MVALEVRSAKRSPWHFKAIAKQSSGLDAVLHLAAGAIEVFVEETGAGLGLGQGGHDETRIGLAAGPFRLGHDPAPSRPTIEGGVAEILEATGGLAGARRFVLSLQGFDGDLLDEPVVARQAKQVIDF